MSLIGVKVTVSEALQIVQEAADRLGAEETLKAVARGLDDNALRQEREAGRVVSARAKVESVLDELTAGNSARKEAEL